MQLGDWRLDTVSGGRFWLDGGAMFGVVPKPLWSAHQPPDERNRIPCDTNCVLARDGRQTVLIDSGYGGKLPAKQREQVSAAEGEPLLESLASLGVAPEQVTAVVFSHLHFDHAGGGVRRDAEGRLRPVFPRAQYFAHRLEWEDAVGGAAELRGSYPEENLAPLVESGQLELAEAGPLLPGVWTRGTGGHTRGHWVVGLESRGQTAVYLGDLCPTRNHLRTLWVMAYDLFPLETRRQKPLLLGEAADQGWWALFDHDPEYAAARLARDPRQEFTLVEPRPRL